MKTNPKVRKMLRVFYLQLPFIVCRFYILNAQIRFQYN